MNNGKLIFAEYNSRRLALLFSGNRLLAARVLPEGNGRIGAIYIGKIKNIVAGINACFVEISNNEICFLPMKEAQAPFLLNRTYDGRLLEGDELVVQLTRESHKTKQASVSAKISIASEYFALNMEGSARIGYSAKLTPEKKEELKACLTDSGILKNNRLCQTPFAFPKTPVPKVGGVIRTQAADCAPDELARHVSMLCNSFADLLKTAPYKTCFSCLKEAQPVYQEVLDSFAYPGEFDEILIEDALLFKEIDAFCKEKMPDKKVRLYTDTSYPLQKLYSIQTHINEALSRRVWLKSGGYLVIEPTEALTVIDVNSGKYEGKKGSAYKFPDKHENPSAYFVNIEAAEEIALQLRLRNLSGMIIVDFISMDSKEQEKSLLQRLRHLVQKDRQKTSVVDITPLGLVEITRKKTDRPLYEQFG